MQHPLTWSSLPTWQSLSASWMGTGKRGGNCLRADERRVRRGARNENELARRLGKPFMRLANNEFRLQGKGRDGKKEDY